MFYRLKRIITGNNWNYRVLEVALDDELELSDYLVNFRRMFGEQAVHAVRTARNRTQV